MIGDGMDQSKWRLPRDPALRQVHSLVKYNRPTCVVHCIWAVGHVVAFFILDKNVRHDSNAVIECVAITLELVHRKLGDATPKSLIYFVGASQLPCMLLLIILRFVLEEFRFGLEDIVPV